MDTPAVRLEPKVMDVLVALAREAGEVVTRERLLADVWDGLHVTEDALNRVISRLRKVFEDDPTAPRFIETIRQRGYRLVAPVHSAEAPPTPTVQPRRLRWSPNMLATGVLVAAAAVGIAGHYMLESSGSTYRASGPRLSKPVPITSLPGEERDPALSPDGESLAFLWNGGDGLPLDLYIKPMRSEELRRLSDDGSLRGSPAWSPDGTRIALVRRAATRELVILDVDRGKSRALIPVGRDVDVRLDWSRDGRRLVMTDRPERGKPVGLYVVEVATGRRSTLVAPGAEGSTPGHPVFFPAGDAVAFTRTYSGTAGEICTVTIADGSVRVLAEVSGAPEGLDTAPDGGLVYALSRGQTGELWWWHPTAGGARRLISSDRFFDLRVTPRGQVLFARWSFDANVWRLDLDATSGESSAAPVLSSSRWDSSPAISTQGDLAFVSLRSGAPELWRARPDGSGVTHVTAFNGASIGPPSWSPDGRRIAIRVDQQVHVIDTFKPENPAASITAGPANHAAPSWSRDGLGLYVVSNQGNAWDIHKTSTMGGKLEWLTDGTSVRESVDGKAIYFTRWQRPGLWRRCLESATCPGPVEERLTHDLDPDDRHNWTVGDRGIYYVASTEDGRKIVFLDLTTGHTTRLGDATVTPYDGGLAVSADGDSLYFVRVDRSDSDLMMARLISEP